LGVYFLNMSSYKEFKSDVGRWGMSYILVSIFLWLLKAATFIISFGLIYLFNKARNKKEINDNFYKI